MTKTKAFNNRTLELVRNFALINDKLKKGESYFLRLEDDPFKMMYLVKDGALYAMVDTQQTQGYHQPYEIATIDHTERLLYLADTGAGEAEHTKRFVKNLKDDYFFYLLEEYFQNDAFSVPLEEMEVIASGNADLISHIEQLHLYAIALNEPDEKLVKALFNLTVLMNSEAPSMDDIERFKSFVGSV